MSFTDFLRCFTHLCICHVQPNTKMNGAIWREKFYHRRWIPGFSAGGCGNDGITSFLTNPHYLLRIRGKEEMVEVNIALMQKGRRQLRDEMGINTFLAIGLTVFKLKCKINGKVSKKDLKGNIPMGMIYEQKRTTTMQAIWTVGDYLVVPATFYRDQEGEFFLRVNIKNNNFQLEEL